MFETTAHGFLNGYNSGRGSSGGGGGSNVLALRRFDALTSSLAAAPRIYRVLQNEDGILESSKILRDWQQVGGKSDPKLFSFLVLFVCSNFIVWLTSVLI